MTLEEFSQYRETRLHEQPGFAYNTYLCTIPLDFPRVRLHWHEQTELIYIKKGSGTVSVNLIPYPVSAGCIVPVMPGELHAIEGSADGPMEYENIIFSLSILDSTAENDWCRQHILDPIRRASLQIPRPLRPGTDFHTEVARALDTADFACARRKPGFSLIVKSQLFLMLHAFYQYRIPAAVPEASSARTRVLKDVLEWIRLHYSEPVTVADAAKAAGYSPSHFMRVFKAETGQTFVSYLTDYRLTAASYYLTETGDPIGAIASRCGFDNFSYFIRLFRKRYGVSPRDYRK